MTTIAPTLNRDKQIPHSLPTNKPHKTYSNAKNGCYLVHLNETTQEPDTNRATAYL